jgi:hypothetical protein
MPPLKQKSKILQAKKKPIPNDTQWCLDKQGEGLTFKEYIEHWGCLDDRKRWYSIIYIL